MGYIRETASRKSVSPAEKDPGNMALQKKSAVGLIQKAAPEEELQKKSAPAQFAGKDEELQLKQAPFQMVNPEEELQKKSAPAQLANKDEELQMKQAPFQMVDPEEELQKKEALTKLAGKDEELQMKQAPFQFEKPEEELQMKPPVQRVENKTGMPDNLKSGIENLSGMDMGDVKVHYNSSQPAQLNALAYAQGNDIHIGPGQEKHLPHEAWHVVQQRQGRVQATKQMKAGVAVNDDPGLEHEADVMGAKAAQLVVQKVNNTTENGLKPFQLQPIQLKTEVEWTSQNFSYMDKETESVETKEVGGTMVAKIDPAEELKGSDAQSSFQKDMYDSLKHYWDPGGKHWVRGHLLNANIGGPNVAPNLFPITGHANGDHLNYVENHVKQWVIDGKKVTYRVTARQEGGVVKVGDTEGVPNAAGSFECYAETGEGETKKVVHRLINSIPQKRAEPGDSAKTKDHTSSWNKHEGVDNSLNRLATLNESQLQYLLVLIRTEGNYKQATKEVPITLDDWGELRKAIEQVLVKSEEEEDDTATSDTQTEKVGHKVTNEKLKKWVKPSLSNGAAEEWLTTNRVAGNNYKVSSS